MSRSLLCRIPLFVLLIPNLALTQGLSVPGHDNGAAARAALAPLAALVGQWEGTATLTTGPGRTIEARQFEEVVWGAERTVLMVRGTGKAMDSDSVVYGAAATIWFDPATGQLGMRAHRAEGVTIVPTIELRTDTLIWGFQSGPGRVQFTIAFTADTWHEVGEFIMPGRPPFRTIEMRLRRK